MKLEHAAFRDIEVQDDCLQFGGMPLTRLAQRVGSTPFYAYDRQAITRRVALLRQHLPEEIHIHYAIKANPMPAVVQHLAGLVDGFDVASAGEMKVALDTIMAPEAIGFAGPAKGEDELNRAVASGVLVNIESEQELERIARVGGQLRIRPKIAIRVNPDFELKSSGMKMGGGVQQFGIDAERVPNVLGRVAALDVDFQGFHIYAGSQNLNAVAIQEAHANTLALAARLAVHTPRPLRILNIGGGFGVPYFPGEEPLDTETIGKHLKQLLPVVKRDFPSARLVIELGRYLVASTGIYVCKVIERKVSRGQVYLVTDGGMNHHLAASGNLGQVIRKNYPVLIGNRVCGVQREIVSVVGPLCTPLDLIADRMETAGANAGDLVAVLQSGAYGLTASPTAFLGRPAPIEVLI